MDERLLNECEMFFRERPVFDKVLRGFREKYASYGRFAGTVVLKALNEMEIEDLEGFLGRSCRGNKVMVSAAKFEKALADSRFNGIDGKTVLELYFHETMEGKRQQLLREENQRLDVFERVRNDASKNGAGDVSMYWLNGIGQCMCDGERREPFGKILNHLKRRYKEADGSLKEIERLLKMGIEIIDSFPADAKYLAVIAAEITGNPHAFDRGTRDGRYFELLIRWYVEDVLNESVQRSGTVSLIERQKMYLRAGILWDDVSNYALAAGLRAVKTDGNYHKGMEGLFNEGEPAQIPLSMIAGWKSVVCPGNKMYIVENPSVYAMMCNGWIKDYGLMCMNGQPRLSSLLILDLLSDAGVEIWYAGDLDPEGLLIAQKIRRYYRGRFHYWHMDPDDYLKSRSDEKLSAQRVKKLEGVTDKQLIKTAKAIKGEGFAGYQENIWRTYVCE